MAPEYAFRPMTAGDLPLVRRWLAEPHVVQWWGDPPEQYELVSGDLESNPPWTSSSSRHKVAISPICSATT